jgi:hypothetical protein
LPAVFGLSSSRYRGMWTCCVSFPKHKLSYTIFYILFIPFSAYQNLRILVRSLKLEKMVEPLGGAGSLMGTHNVKL